MMTKRGSPSSCSATITRRRRSAPQCSENSRRLFCLLVFWRSRLVVGLKQARVAFHRPAALPARILELAAYGQQVNAVLPNAGEYHSESFASRTGTAQPVLLGRIRHHASRFIKWLSCEELTAVRARSNEYLPPGRSIAAPRAASVSHGARNHSTDAHLARRMPVFSARHCNETVSGPMTGCARNAFSQAVSLGREFFTTATDP